MIVIPAFAENMEVLETDSSKSKLPKINWNQFIADLKCYEAFSSWFQKGGEKKAKEKEEKKKPLKRVSTCFRYMNSDTQLIFYWTGPWFLGHGWTVFVIRHWMVAIQHHVTLGSSCSIQVLLKFNSVLSAVSWLSDKAMG